MKMHVKIEENRVLEQHIAYSNILCKHTVQSIIIQEEKQADSAAEQMPSCHCSCPSYFFCSSAAVFY